MLKDLVTSCRSFRTFDESLPLGRDTLLSLVELARLTASTRNAQPLRYRLVHTPEECAATLPFTRWAASLGIKLPPDGKAPTAYIVICCDTELAPNTTPFLRDVGIVAQTILLGAVERGFGGCMIGSFNGEAISEALGIDKKYQPMLIVALGKPAEEIVLTDAEDGNITYYRKSGKHFVPKRKTEDIIL